MRKLIVSFMVVLSFFYIVPSVDANMFDKSNTDVLLDIISKKGEGYTCDLMGWSLDKAHRVLLKETQHHKDIKEIDTSFISPDKRTVILPYKPSGLFKKWRMFVLHDTKKGVIKLSNMTEAEFKKGYEAAFGKAPY